MAAMIACKRAAQKLLASPSRRLLTASSQSAARSFNTNAQMREVDEDERGIAVDRRGERGRVARRRRSDGDFPDFLSGVLDPFNPTRSLSQVLNMMEQMADGPLARGGARRGWDAREDEEALQLQIDMPGLGKEHVRVSAEQNTLIIKGEGEKESGGEEGRRYSSRIELPEGMYKMEGIKAEMKNGVLKVVVPKVKKEERKDVFQVNVD